MLRSGFRFIKKRFNSEADKKSLFILKGIYLKCIIFLTNIPFQTAKIPVTIATIFSKCVILSMQMLHLLKKCALVYFAKVQYYHHLSSLRIDCFVHSCIKVNNGLYTCVNRPCRLLCAEGEEAFGLGVDHVSP